MNKLSQNQKKVFLDVCNRLGVSSDLLYRLIDYESGWQPLRKNPYSSARGLIQFIDDTAKWLGYKNSLDLVSKHPTIDSQLGVVYEYLSRFAPFTNDQSLFMSVFYPEAREWNLDREFPLYVQNVNPGIRTVRDYMNFVYSKLKIKKELEKPNNLIYAIIAGIAVTLFFINKRV